MINQIMRWLRFNLFYLGKPPWDTGITPPEVYEFMAGHPTGSVLDLGCGTGTNLLTFLHHGWKACGVDFSPLAVKKAKENIDRAGLKADVYTADVSNLPFLHKQFDLILDIGCYHGLHLAARPAYQSTVDRLLIPGGFFLIYAHLRNPTQHEGPSSSRLRAGFSQQDELKFKAYFELVKRVDSHDRFGREATWMTFRKPG
jgi:SAM-dependent methyltransferase